MARAGWIVAALATACGHRDPPSVPAVTIDAAPGPALAPPAPDAAPRPVSAICSAAREQLLGPDADCDEQRIADTSAGTLWRVCDRADPFAHCVHVIEHADHGLATKWSDAFLDVAPLLAHASPEAQARICAELEARIVRCLPGDAFLLPPPLVCEAPYVDVHGHVVAILGGFHFFADQYQETQPYQPFAEQERWRPGSCAVVPRADPLDGILHPDPIARPPRVAWLAPPPAYLVHERAPAAIERAVCDAAETQLGRPLRCEAWRFPQLATSRGTVYFASTDAGRADVLVRARADGALIAGAGEEITRDMWPALLDDVRAGRLAPGALVELRFLAAAWQRRVTDPKLVASDAHSVTIEATFDDLGRAIATMPWGVHHSRKKMVIKDDGTWDWIPPRGID